MYADSLVFSDNQAYEETIATTIKVEIHGQQEPQAIIQSIIPF